MSHMLCVFHSKAATDYTAKLPPISHESASRAARSAGVRRSVMPVLFVMAGSPGCVVD